jgi:hypothetical protein
MWNGVVPQFDTNPTLMYLLRPVSSPHATDTIKPTKRNNKNELQGFIKWWPSPSSLCVVLRDQPSRPIRSHVTRAKKRSRKNAGAAHHFMADVYVFHSLCLQFAFPSFAITRCPPIKLY